MGALGGGEFATHIPLRTTLYFEYLCLACWGDGEFTAHIPHAPVCLTDFHFNSLLFPCISRAAKVTALAACPCRCLIHVVIGGRGSYPLRAIGAPCRCPSLRSPFGAARCKNKKIKCSICSFFRTVRVTFDTVPRYLYFKFQFNRRIIVSSVVFLKRKLSRKSQDGVQLC
jgi:hypothetical protein